jgi:hypothetical protein
MKKLSEDKVLITLIISESIYKGMIGITELLAFYNKATPEQKEELNFLVRNNKNDDAWILISNVLGIEIPKIN